MDTNSLTGHRIVPVTQGSDEWREWRATRYTASEAAIIMGCPASYWETKNWDDLRLVKVGLRQEPTSFQKSLYARGHAAESRIRDAMQERFQTHFPAICVESNRDPMISASLDGWNPDTRVWLEIKFCATGTRANLWKALHDKKPSPPQYIIWQLVHQALALGFEDARCILAVGVDDHTGPDEPGLKVATWEVTAKELLGLDDAASLLTRWRAFDLGEAQYGDARALAAYDWLQAHRANEDTRADLDEARTLLLGFDDGKADGVSVNTFDVKGRVNWQKVAADLFQQVETLSASLHLSFTDTLPDLSEKKRGQTTTTRKVSALR